MFLTYLFYFLLMHFLIPFFLFWNILYEASLQNNNLTIYCLMKGRKQGFENFIQRPCVRRTKIWREKLSLTKMLQCMHNIQSTHYCTVYCINSSFYNISTPSLSFLFFSFHRSQADNFHYKLLLVIFFDFDSVYRGAGFFFPFFSNATWKHH